MSRVLVVALGGAVGSAARYLVAGLAQRLSTAFPIGTFTVNVAGCLLVGFVAGLVLSRPGLVTPGWRLFLVIGVCGGFTTFSAFSFETLELVRGGQLGPAAVNTLGQVAIGLAAVWAGLVLSRLL